jgi:hypothetical protein
VLYHLSHSTSPFLCWVFSRGSHAWTGCDPSNVYLLSSQDYWRETPAGSFRSMFYTNLPLTWRGPGVGRGWVYLVQWPENGSPPILASQEPDSPSPGLERVGCRQGFLCSEPRVLWEINPTLLSFQLDLPLFLGREDGCIAEVMVTVPMAATVAVLMQCVWNCAWMLSGKVPDNGTRDC